MRSLSPVLLLLAAFATANPSGKYVRLQTYRAKRETYLSKRDLADPTDLNSALLNDQDNLAYYIDLEIGSNKEKVTCQLDTGSADFFVFSSNEKYCYDSELADCGKYGTFNYNTSTSFHQNDTSLKIIYGDSDAAYGVFGTDNVYINGVEITDVSFGVSTSANTSSPLLGVGFKELGSAYDSDGNQVIYDTFPYALADDGIINIPAYSISLLDDSVNSTADSTVTFGAYDTSRYVSSLSKFPIPVGSTLDTQTDVGILLNALYIQESDDGDMQRFASGDQFVLLDTGTTFSTIPTDAYEYIGDNYFSKYDDTNSIYSTDSCDDLSGKTLYFTFLGVAYPVPLSNFGKAISDYYSSGVPSGYNSDSCVFTMFPSDGDYSILGDDFLKSVYMVVDLENKEVALASSNGLDLEDTKSPNFVEIESSIPGADDAPYYSEGTTYVFSSSLTIDTAESTSSLNTGTVKSSATTTTAAGSHNNKDQASGSAATATATSTATDTASSEASMPTSFDDLVNFIINHQHDKKKSHKNSDGSKW